MAIPSQYELDKALVSKAIEYTLLGCEKNIYKKMLKLLEKRGLSISDCFDHPDYFRQILKELFGQSYTEIIHSIQIWLDDSASNKLISDFLLTVLRNDKPASDSNLTSSVILLAIEKSLLTMGIPELKRVESQLLSEYGCTLEDCVNNPIPLKKILHKLFGNCYEDIYQSMNYTLEQSSMDENITQFLIMMKD